jgi:hypothetical protein
VIYIDSSVVLAHLFGEDRAPPAHIWDLGIVSSRLLEYEIWNRMHARGHGHSNASLIATVIGRFAFVELGRDVLGRLREPFPIPVRTLDAIHLASVAYLMGKRQNVELLTYDERMLDAARAMELPLLSITS